MHSQHVQNRILMRGLQLLAVGGLLASHAIAPHIALHDVAQVYSTCSLNPIENEAVVAHTLAALKGVFLPSSLLCVHMHVYART